MASKKIPELLISSLLLVFSVTCRTLIWCWLAPPTAFSFLGAPRYQEKNTTTERLSAPLHDLKPSYDVVVIGSGYGGGVAASRMARAAPKQSVCVLESGDERWSVERGFWYGGFPSSVREVLSEIRVTGHLYSRFFKPWPFSFGNTNGLYRWICGKESNAFVANGLGGGSLVNANVFLKPDPRVFQSPEWPSELRTSGALNKYFDRAEAMLQPESYPEHLPHIPKHTILRRQAIAAGVGKQFYSVRQTTAFSDKINAAGVHLKASTLSGQDSVGLNDGSKNTVLATYLTDACNFGAEIYCGCDVRYIRKHPVGGYLVFFRDSASKLLSGSFKEKLRWVHAKQFVFLGAGSIGSTEIILRSRDKGLPTSTRIGKGLSGNGGMLSFGYDLDPSLGEVNPKERPGPTISAMIDIQDKERWEQSFIVQDGAWPSLMDTMFRITKPMLPVTLPTHISVSNSLKRVSRILNPFTDALRHTQIYLALGHDTPCGSLTLQKDVPLLDMRGVERETTSARIKNLLLKMTHALGGSYMEQRWKVTVHPLGGLGYASDGTGLTGSTSHTGELFAGESQEVHAGLCVVDGSVICRSLSANPLATITAAAERSVDLLAERYGLRIDLSSTKSSPKRYQTNTVSFAEKMQGTLDFGGSRAQFTLYADVEISSEKRASRNGLVGRLSGTLHCSHLSNDQLTITDGSFRLLEPDPARAGRSAMVYQFTAVATNGNHFAMTGKKFIDPSVTFSASKLWQATTTLFIGIDDTNGQNIGSGVLRLSLRSFIDQMRTMTTNGDGMYGRRTFLMHFLTTFASGLLERFLLPFAPLQYPKHSHTAKQVSGYIEKVEPKAKFELKATDGVTSTLRMWEPVDPRIDTEGVVHDILFLPGTSVSHYLYASPYVKQNAVEYFTQRGYRCWCLTSRFGKQDENAATNTPHAWTSYDGRLDVAAALVEIKRYNTRQSSQALPPYIIAHCAGSLALSSALLDGTVPKTATSGITASQIFLYPILQPMNELKAHLPLVRLYRLLAGDWLPLAPTENQTSSSVIQSLLDTLLRFYPVGSRSEICNSTACHRNNLAWGRVWSHKNLNKATHDNLQHVFGGTSGRCLEHLANGGRRQIVADNDYRSLVTEENLERLRGIPVFVFSGKDNAVFKAESTVKTFEVLKARGERVRREEFEGLGHMDCWMSERVAEVVYPVVEEEVRRVMASSSDRK